MSKVLRNGLLVLLAVALVALPAYANLVPTTFGFPVIVQNGSTSAFNQDAALATDFENVNINFPMFNSVGDVFGPSAAANGGTALFPGGGGLTTVPGSTASANVLPFGPVDLAFPSISQTVNQSQAVTHTDFAQTNEFAEFAYPFVGVGGVALPGFGFGF